MDFFEFILIITSVVYALCLAPLLTGVARLIQTDREVRYFLPHTLWTLFMFFSVIIVWWTMWAFRNVEWHFATFMYIIIEPTMLYVTCSLAFPQRLKGDVVDLERHLTKVWRPSVLTLFVFSVLLYLDGFVLGTEPLFHSGRYLQGTMLITLIWAYVQNGRAAMYITPVVVISSVALLVVTRFWMPPGQV